MEELTGEEQGWEETEEISKREEEESVKNRERLKVEGTQREGIIKKQQKDVRLPPKKLKKDERKEG
jgi:hypothetical protein